MNLEVWVAPGHLPDIFNGKTRRFLGCCKAGDIARFRLTVSSDYYTIVATHVDYVVVERKDDMLCRSSKTEET